MRIVLLCATRRGYVFLQKLAELLPTHEIIVFSFKGESWEPKFMEDIQAFCAKKAYTFFENRQVSTELDFWSSTKVDLILAVNWRYLIPLNIYELPNKGTFVFHDSLLPRYRGFSPTVWAMINGEVETGVTLFSVKSEKMDDGPIVDQIQVKIGSDDYVSDVLEVVTNGYLALLERNIDQLLSGSLHLKEQNHLLANYTCKRTLKDNEINWSESSSSIYNMIRALSFPYPGAYTYLDGKKIYIWAAKNMKDLSKYVGKAPGRIVEVCLGEGAIVLTGDGSLLLTQVALENHDTVCAADVLNSLSITLGVENN